jgi:hypothetical protein
LKNVYSIFQYPDPTKQIPYQPSIGLISLINASVASQDFYAVRSLHESLTSVSSNQQAASGQGQASSSSPANSSGGDGSATGHKIVSGGVIAAASVIGFFVLAAAIFFAWWFWLRRKMKSEGSLDYEPGSVRPLNTDGQSDLTMSTARTRKREDFQRQKSMMEGYSDVDGESWLSNTEGKEGFHMKHLSSDSYKDVAAISAPPIAYSSRDSVHGNRHSDIIDYSTPAPLLIDMDADTEIPPVVTPPMLIRQDDSPGRRHQHRPKSSRSQSSLSMSGPFPVPNRPPSLQRPDSSPIQDTLTSDHVAASDTVVSARGRSDSSHVNDGGGSAGGWRKRSPSEYRGSAHGVLFEEPGEL